MKNKVGAPVFAIVGPGFPPSYDAVSSDWFGDEAT